MFGMQLPLNAYEQVPKCVLVVVLLSYKRRPDIVRKRKGPPRETPDNTWSQGYKTGFMLSSAEA